MARKPLRPLIRGGGFYPSKKWTPLVYAGGYTTANGGGEPEPPPIEKTITGNPIHITDALAKPVQALSVKLEPIQDLNGYDNPWPAGGGTNLANIMDMVVNASASTVTNTETASGSTSVGVTGDTGAYRSMFIDIDATDLVGQTVTMSGSQAIEGGASLGAQIRAITGGTSTTLASSADANFSLTVVIPSCDTVRLFFGITGNTGAVGATKTISNLRLNIGSSDLGYAPYTNICPISGHSSVNVIVSPTLNPLDGTTYPIPLGTTVYGGTLDVLTGVLTVDRAMVDAGTLNWNYSGDSSNHRFSAAMPSNYKIPTSSIDRANIVCSSYASNPSVVSNNNALGISGYQGTSTMFIRDLAFSDAASFNASMPGVQLVYELATPQTIQLTPQQVELLLGENNIWSDGTMTLVYLADGNASDVEALNILLGNRYVNNHTEDEPSDREALDILLSR